ncbi:synaptic vesicle glycoprotein 2A-like [Tribolium castaneum]|uniref:Synaptic vesicle glycoprotein 2B-like Protein n=1 Tax=Tribolium castaneum TaxID=7070 RepID=D6WB99_TRICA|nr:PREDICTED: synaptic vesicle glycoprotein 2A-like [Tribolium castaneum]EEZ97916.1 Synaptic vesicle glycoprotein 2B-like Protein [Tribolium castaneum]|eukprot:XP_015840524.1 PREDICTED: synaptic vesicle glycoprotein 2A-like [Tribolium castaneum]
MSEKHLYSYDEFKITAEKFKNVEFEEALEHTGFGKYNLALILICGLTLYGVNSEAYAVGYVLPSAECDLELDTYMKGILTSTNFIGITGTCCIWGYLSDTKGRKSVLTISLILAFVCSVAAAFVPSFWGFAILRFCNGIFIAGPSAIVYAYFGEFQNRIYRSTAMAWMSLFIALALITLPGLGWSLLPQHLHLSIFGLTLNSWRLFMLLISIPNLLAAIAFIKLPESPKFLYHNGQLEEAIQVLRQIYTINTGKPGDTFPVESLDDKVLLQVDPNKNKNILMDFWGQIAPLFVPPHLKYSLASGVMQGGVFAVSSGVLLWYPDIINQLSHSANSNVSVTVCQALSSVEESAEEAIRCVEDNINDQVFIQNIIIGVAYLVFYVVWGFVVNFLGNRNFFGLCMIVSAVSLVLLNFLTHKVLIDVLFVVLLTLPGICVAVINLLMVDIIPTHLCGMAVCLVMTAGRIGSIVSSSVVGVMLQWNCTVTFNLYAVNLIVCLLLIFVFPKHST